MKRLALFIFLTVISLPGVSQFRFNSVFPPSASPLEWSGGWNAPQFSVADLNGDGEQDLVVFDRTNANVQTFLNSGNLYAPEYERAFPEDLEGWMLMRDYDCDGRKDIFTRSPFGIRVFRNTSSGSELSFELFKNIVFTEGTNGQINLQVNITDIPVIEDIDFDGDLDILTFNPGTGGNVEYHQNQTLENYGTCDSLEFVRVEERWGDFEECFCQDFAFGETCEEKNGGRVLHASGKAILAVDYDGDGDKDFIYGDESCDEIQYLENIGDSQNALIRDFTIDFPNATDPVAFSTFPATYYEDVNFDGVKDLVFAPNVFSNTTGAVDFAKPARLYVNTGTAQNPDYQLTEFGLQNAMIDLGERAAPAFVDWDGDGDLDMIVGFDGVENGQMVARLALFENQGSTENPFLRLEDEDLLGFGSLDLLRIRPYFHDLDNDGSIDLILTGTVNPPVREVLFYRNSADPGEAIEIDPGGGSSININSTTSENLAFFDDDNDGNLDLFIGTSQGNLAYYRSTSQNPITFEFVRNDYAGIIPDPERPSLVPHFEDLDNNGEAELITLDRTGKVRIYADVRLSLNPEATENIIGVADELFPTTFGDRTVISSADLSSRNKPSLFFGTAQGGIMHLYNFTNDGSTNGQKISFQIYPNPVSQQDDLQVTILSNRPGVYQIISITGQVIQEDVEIPGNTPTVLDLSVVPPGLYLIRAQSPGFGSSSGKIIVSE